MFPRLGVLRYHVHLERERRGTISTYSIRIHCVKSNVYFVWSEPVNTSLVHEHFLGVPGCGDVTLHLEKLANTTHVYVEPLSKVEVSAKEIRARIQSTPTMSRYTSDHYFLSLEVTF